MDKKELLQRMRKASSAIYIAADKVVADDISQMLLAAAEHIDALERQLNQSPSTNRFVEGVDGWINELGLLAQHPADMSLWLRNALKTIYLGLKNNAPIASAQEGK